MVYKQSVEQEWSIEEQEKSLNIVVSTKLHHTQLEELLAHFADEYGTCNKDIYVQVSEVEFNENNVISSDKWKKEIAQHVFILDALKVKELPIFNRNHLKEGFTIHSIQELTPQDIDFIEKGENVWFPTRFHPLCYDTVATNSLILRHHKELVGWCVVLPSTNQLLMYDNLFVKERYQSLGRSLTLFWHAILLQLEQTPMKYLTFVVDGENEKMLKVLRNKVHAPLIDYQKVTVFKLMD
ncbi:hypothetical protein [Lysinibacillus boronitolerans]|uniref:hypothetical protein n=1 Tax=Lysinibacillus boronitolerans TaxID=309788 RepID=UPI0002E29DFC|nr:hypothetical protein [Lysinibacillus boronitolerans]